MDATGRWRVEAGAVCLAVARLSDDRARDISVRQSCTVLLLQSAGLESRPSTGQMQNSCTFWLLTYWGVHVPLYTS